MGRSCRPKIKKATVTLNQGSPTPRPWAAIGPWPVRNQATQQEMSSKQGSKLRSCYHLSSAACLPATPSPWKNRIPWNWSLVPVRLGTAALKDTLDRLDLIDIYGTILTKAAEYACTFFSSAHRTFLKIDHTLAAVAQLIGHCPAKWRVTGSIPSQGTCLGCEFGPQSGCVQEQLISVSLSHWCFSPSLSPSLPLFLNQFKKGRSHVRIQIKS